MSCISILNLNALELISNFLSVNEILNLLLSNKYYKSHLEYILITLVSNKYSISIDELKYSCFKLSFIENYSSNIKLYDEIDTSDYSIQSTLKVFYLYSKNDENAIFKMLDYIDDVFNIKYHTRRDIYVYNIFKKILSGYDKQIKIMSRCPDYINDMYSDWSELNINLYILYESYRLMNKKCELRFKENLLYKKSIIIDDELYSRHQLSFMVLITHNLKNKKLKVYTMYELFRLVYIFKISNNYEKIMGTNQIHEKFNRVVLNKMVEIRNDLLDKTPKLMPKYFTNIMFELFDNITSVLK